MLAIEEKKVITAVFEPQPVACGNQHQEAAAILDCIIRGADGLDELYQAVGADVVHVVLPEGVLHRDVLHAADGVRDPELKQVGGDQAATAMGGDSNAQRYVEQGGHLHEALRIVLWVSSGGALPRNAGCTAFCQWGRQGMLSCMTRYTLRWYSKVSKSLRMLGWSMAIMMDIQWAHVALSGVCAAGCWAAAPFAMLVIVGGRRVRKPWLCCPGWLCGLTSRLSPTKASGSC